MPAYDRLVDVQQRVATRDAYGGEVVSWATLYKVWAQVETRGSNTERYENQANRELAARTAVFRFPWRDGIDETHRLVFDNHAWDIEGMAEIGYRRVLELYAETDVGRRITVSPLSVIAGLSTDAMPDAAELTLMLTDGAFTFAPFTDRYILLARLSTEPDFTAAVLRSDATGLNQIQAFTKFPSTVTVDSKVYNVWVSNQLLTFSEEQMMEVA